MKTQLHQIGYCVRALAPVMLLLPGCQGGKAVAPTATALMFHDARQTVSVEVTDTLAPLFSGLQPERTSQSRWKEILLGPESTDRKLVLPRIPQGLAIRGGQLYVCDPGLPDIVVVDLSTGKMRRWTSAAARPACPVDITFDESGSAYVADTTLGAILAYDADGSRFETIQPPRGSGDPALHPAGVLAAADIVYVSDPRHRTVERFRPSDRSWLSPLTASDRPFLAPVGLARTPQGDVLIADALAGMVHRVDSSGNPSTPIGSRGRGPGQFVRPLHVACTPDGLIFVVDAAQQSVQVFEAAGNYLMEIAGEADWPGFTLPAAIVAFARTADSNAGVSGTAQGKVGQWLMVSDSLGPAPLMLLKVSTTQTSVPGNADVTSTAMGRSLE